ncbi:MAG: pre-peptidase C-terminal domain-containing protein [Flavobacteriaceae bacterium]|nr:pre-peptidase C-terminal domain-containing protein [Flavobacteriaceae bacterium]
MKRKLNFLQWVSLGKLFAFLPNPVPRVQSNLIPLLLVVGMFLPSIVWSQTESEPNNDVATANEIDFETTISGEINVNGDMDYYVLTTTSNGKIRIDFSHSGADNQYTYVYLYSSTSQNLAQVYTNSTSYLERDGLAAGTYYVKINSYYSGHTHAYSFTPSFISIPTANDMEPNGSYTDAQSIALNSSIAGQVGYREFNENPADAQDWFKVNADLHGKLSIRLETLIDESVYVYLYDGNGTTVLAQGYTTAVTGNTKTIEKDGLAPGEYYIRVNTYYTVDFAPYILTNQLILPPHPSEGNNNENVSEAQTLALNSSVNGLVGYRYNGNVDLHDWYSVTTDANGKLQISLQTLNPELVYVYLYDGNGTSTLAQGYTNGTIGNTVLIEKDGLAPGEYFIRVNTYYSGDFAPYILTNQLILPPHPSEGDNNENVSEAQTLALNSSVNGLVGYRYNGNVDLHDWYSVTTDANGKLQLSLQTLIDEWVYVFLYDGNGTSTLAQGYTNNETGNTVTIEKDGLAPGEYYIRVNTYYTGGFAPYILTNQLIEPATPEDENDDANDVYTGANTLNLNIPSFGHIGYKYINDRDESDWYAFNWPSQTDFKLNLKVYNGQNIYIQLYAANGTTLISQVYTTTSTSINRENLAAGDYFVRIKTYYTNEFGPYRISTGIDTDNDGYADVIDCEPDDPTVWFQGTFYLDADGDGYHGESNVLCYGDEIPEGYTDTTLGSDCNDSDASIYPGATEIPNDGIDQDCDGSDIIEFDCPDLSANVGDACDDGDDTTENDVITEDCACLGTPIPPIYDCPELNANIGDACDDGDDTTENDVVTEDCACLGTPIPPIYDCPELNANIGDACDDGDDTTENDVVTEDCGCVGTQNPPVDGVCNWTVHVWGDSWGEQVYWELRDNNTGDILLQNFGYDLGYDDTATIQHSGPVTFWITNEGEYTDNLPNYEISNGTQIVFYGHLSPNQTITSELLYCEEFIPVFDCPELGANIGDACDDGDANTENDVITEDCECAGTPIPPVFDCPELGANIGDACDDGDANTENDVITEDCGCAGTPIPPVFDCPELGANIGDACDDGDANTENDVITEDCECAGTPIPPVFDCPELGANIGDACDDGDANTENDVITEDCECAGTPIATGDTDGDGVADDVDNCPDTYNPDQADWDGDGIGDACDTCDAPTGVMVTRLSGTTASFTADDTTARYQGSANRAGRPLRAYPMYGMEDIRTGHIQQALVPSFDYDIWFRTSCPGGTFSEWVGPFYLPMYNGAAARTEIALTPNPTYGVVQIAKVESKTIEVYDMNGAKLMEINTANNQFDISELPTGKYNLRIIDTDGNTHFEQVIKK